MIILFSMLTQACNKDNELLTEHLAQGQIENHEFFKRFNPDSEESRQIWQAMAELNKNQEFISAFHLNAGYARWDKSLVLKEKQVTIIPLVDKHNYKVLGLIAGTKVNDELQLRYALLKDYRQFGSKQRDFVLLMIQLENHVFGHTEFNLKTEDVFGVAGKILVKEKIHRQNYSGTLLAHQACSTYEILIEVNEQYYDSYTVYIGDCFSNPQNGDYVIPIIGGGYLEIPHHGSGGGGGGTPAAPYLSTHAEKMDHLMTILDLNMDSPDFLAGDMVLVSEVYDFVYNNPDASSLQDISMHVNRIVSDLNYADFISDYRTSPGGTLFPWWKNVDWLDEPDNFNFDIENLSQNYDRLNRAEKALISLFPFQAYTIAKNKAHAEAISQATNLPNPLNGKQDAFRHAFFQAINTRDVPPKFLDGKVYTASEIVSLFAMAHESEVPDVLSLERDMDIFNNNKGIAAGATATNHSNQMVANTIMQLLVIGELKYISPLDFVASEKFDKDRDGVQDCSTCLNGILPNSILVPTNQ